jgi:hypothetical protein
MRTIRKTLSKLTPDLSLTTFRLQLASLDSVPQFALLGIFSADSRGLHPGYIIVPALGTG